jgi:hypothetical protein
VFPEILSLIKAARRDLVTFLLLDVLIYLLCALFAVASNANRMSTWNGTVSTNKQEPEVINMTLGSDHEFGKWDSEEDIGADYGVDFGTDVGKDFGADFRLNLETD